MGLLYGIKIWAVDYFLLSGFTRLTDGQMDRRTDRKATEIPCVYIRCRTVKTSYKLMLVCYLQPNL